MKLLSDSVRRYNIARHSLSIMLLNQMCLLISENLNNHIDPTIGEQLVIVKLYIFLNKNYLSITAWIKKSNWLCD